jgi:hypothetical protein
VRLRLPVLFAPGLLQIVRIVEGAEDDFMFVAPVQKIGDIE